MERILKKTEEILTENNIIFEETYSDGPDIGSTFILNETEKLIIQIEKIDKSILTFEFPEAYIEKYASIAHKHSEIGFNIFSEKNDNKIQIKYSFSTGKEHILINDSIMILSDEIKDINIYRAF